MESCAIGHYVPMELFLRQSPEPVAQVVQIHQTATMDLLVKIIGERKVPLSLGKPVKNGQNKLHTATTELLKGRAPFDITTSFNFFGMYR